MKKLFRKSIVPVTAFILLFVACNSDKGTTEVPAKEKTESYCQAFHKNSDGSWTSIGSTTIQGSNGSIQINPGVTFSKGVLFMGIDLVKQLEENCQKK